MPVTALSDRLIGLIRDGLPTGETIGVALSGGGDSTALLRLCLRAGLPVEAVTVDHRLRPESADEAAAVAATCAQLDVPHAVRIWEHGPISGNLMDRARRARMALILGWAQERRLRVVALGHTRDDQAETVLMGLARSAGIAGLSGMRSSWEDQGVNFCRPLLGAGRTELRHWLRGEGIPWIDDPTNDNLHFTRIRARRALDALGPLGITAESLADVAAKLAEVQAALVTQVAEAARRLIHEEAGALRVDPAIHQEPKEVRRHLVTLAVRWLSGAEYAPRAGDVERLIGAMTEGRDATLAGSRWRQGWLMREPRAVTDMRARIGAIWDQRWQLSGPEIGEAEVRALGPDGLRLCADWRKTGLAGEILQVTPAIWQGNTLVSAPLAGLSAGWRAETVRPFHLFRLSH